MQAFVCRQKSMRYGHILISSLGKRLNKKVRLGTEGIPSVYQYIVSKRVGIAATQRALHCRDADKFNQLRKLKVFLTAYYLSFHCPPVVIR